MILTAKATLDPQTAGFKSLEQVGQGEYALNCAEFEVEELIAKFRSLEANAAEIRREIEEHLAPLRHALDEQYNNVFALIGLGTPSTASAHNSLTCVL